MISVDILTVKAAFLKIDAMKEDLHLLKKSDVDEVE